MPCYDGPDPYGTLAKALDIEVYRGDSDWQEVLASQKNIINGLTERNDKLARMMCFIMTNCPENVQQLFCDANLEICEWWDEHKKFDRQR